MDFVIATVNVCGSIALLLWGMHMIQTGIQRAFGPRLRSFLGSTLSNRVFAFFAGMGVTALLQSSTATALMATSFAADGLVALVPALAIVLGANVGTALIVQLLAFPVAAFAPVLVLIGYLLFRRSTSQLIHDLGRVFIGLGLMLIALHQMLGVLDSVESAPAFSALFVSIAGVSALNLVLAGLAAWAVHSSVAVVLLIMSMASFGVLSLDQAMFAVLGANLGTALNPLLEGGGEGRPEARRLPVGNLLNRVLGCLIAVPLVPVVAGHLSSIGFTIGQSVALFHLGFNLVLALALLPLLKPMARLLTIILPDVPQPTSAAEPLYLDRGAKETPIVAIGGAAREALRLPDILEEMLTGTRVALAKGDRKVMAETRQRDDVLDSLNEAINRYLTSIDPEDLSEADRRRINQVLAFSMNMEQAGDVIGRYLLPHATKRLKRGLVFSSHVEVELLEMMDRVVRNLHTAATVFMTEDKVAARRLAEEKIAFRSAESAATRRHFELMRSGGPTSAQTSAIYLDLLRDLKQINSHIVAAAAYPVLDSAGELLPSRLTIAADS